MTLSQMGGRAMQHVEQLSSRIGPRPLGSTANLAASDYIYQQFIRMGMAAERQPFTCPEWKSQAATLLLDGKPLPVVANTFSPSCDLSAPLVVAGCLPELESMDIQGRIAVLYGDLTQGTGFSARGGFYFPEKDRQVFHLLETKRPAAVITVHSKIGWTERLMRDWQFPIPSATVPAEAGLELLAGTGRPARLQIESERSGGSQPGPFCNVIARQPGKQAHRLVVCAHFDTMEESPGAVDNASGVSILFALAESFSGRELPLSLEWLALNGEETGGIGDAAYLEGNENTLQDILAVINCDGIGQRLGVNTVALLGCSKAFQDLVQGLLGGYPSLLKVDPWFESDHTAYYFHEVPCLALSSTGVGNVCHTTADTIQWVSPQKLGEAADFIREVIERLRDQTPSWSRETANINGGYND